MGVIEGNVIGDVRRLKEALPGLPEPVVRPFLIILSGLPGTGKSYFGCKLSERLPCAVITSDALRKILFPIPAYDIHENQRLFAALNSLIEDLLRKNVPVLLDATNLVEHHRERLYQIADRLNVKLVIVRVEAPDEIVKKGCNPGLIMLIHRICQMPILEFTKRCG